MTENSYAAHPTTLRLRPVSAIDDIDLAAFAVAMSRRLFAAGRPVTPERAMRFADALELMGPVSRSRLYFTARTVLVSDPVHLPAFHRVFAAVFAGDAEQAPALGADAA